MTIHIHDSYANELDHNDVVLVTYPNPKIIYVGYIHLDSRYQQVIIQGDTGYELLNHNRSNKYERICNLSERPELKDILGRWEGKKLVASILKTIYS